MGPPLRNAIGKYIEACSTTDWVADEIYKFEFANYIDQNVDWATQSKEEVYEILVKSQKLRYTNSSSIGLQFLYKSKLEKPGALAMADVDLFSKLNNTAVAQIDWSNRTMSYSGISAWLATLFPNKFYPIPLKGYDHTIAHLFSPLEDPFPKVGIKYQLACQPYMSETENMLRDFSLDKIVLSKWKAIEPGSSGYSIQAKSDFEKVDWVWLVQDFHLFVHRNILNLYKSKGKGVTRVIQDEHQPIAIEGKSALATHMRYERNPAFIKKVKEKAMQRNRMLNCEACGFSFLETYGEIGEGFIEAHHLNPLNEREGEKVTKAKDIALLCSNCHRMVHRGERVLSLKELKALMNN